MPVGRPASHLLLGRYHLLRGRAATARALFARSLASADQLGFRYEAALALGWLGRTTPGRAGRTQLQAALLRMQEMGVAWDVAEFTRWLDESG